jgi:hypothetical protein
MSGNAPIHIDRLSGDNAGGWQREKRHDICDILRLVGTVNSLSGQDVLQQRR